MAQLQSMCLDWARVNTGESEIQRRRRRNGQGNGLDTGGNTSAQVRCAVVSLNSTELTYFSRHTPQGVLHAPDRRSTARGEHALGSRALSPDGDPQGRCLADLGHVPTGNTTSFTPYAHVVGGALGLTSLAS